MPVDCSPPDPMAAQMAQLLLASDVQELEEIVRRWVAEAPSEALRRHYETFGHKLLDMKQALAESPVQPTREELEFTLTMMLRLAAQGAGPPNRT